MTLSKWIVAASMLLLLQTAGLDARVSRDSSNPAWILGQVVYFAARCPELRTQRIREIIDAFCPYSRVAPADCEDYKADTFKRYAEAGATRLKDEFRDADDAEVCRAGLDRYGSNGSLKPGMLRIRR
jgi:hypothetical protein